MDERVKQMENKQFQVTGIRQVWSDNYNGVFFTLDAYKELTLEMSSGDFGSHIVLSFVGKISSSKLVMSEKEKQELKGA